MVHGDGDEQKNLFVFLQLKYGPPQTPQLWCITMPGRTQKSNSTTSSQIYKSIRAKSGDMMEAAFLNHIWNVKLRKQQEQNRKEKTCV